MKKFSVAVILAISISSMGVVHAQRHAHRARPAQIDTQNVATAAEARIAAGHRALRLNADQEELWQPVASALRDFSQVRIDRMNARIVARNSNNGAVTDAETRQRERADRVAAEAEASELVAKAARPLYRTLTPRQKRRLSTLIRRETNWRHPVLGEAPARHPVLGRQQAAWKHPVLGRQETTWEHPVLGQHPVLGR